MSYAGQDHAAAVSDLIEFDSDMIEIGGRKYKAHIERGQITQDASELGLDNREESLNATIVNQGSMPDFETPVRYRGKAFKITGITPEGEKIITLNLSND